MTTVKLYYQDSYMREFKAKVISCQRIGPDETFGHYEVVLDRTAFFPESGGQYSDGGTLKDILLLDVYEREGVIYHLTQAPLPVGEEITGVLDWQERFMKMQQHSAEHIVSGLIHRIFDYDNVGFHLGSENSTLDFNGEISQEQLKEVEWRANEVLVQNLDLIENWPSKKELDALVFRSKMELKEAVRIITIPGVDDCACCAPHVKKTGEIGLIKLTSVIRYKGGVRITMLCGFRALADYARKEALAKSLSVLLSAQEGEIVTAVETLQGEVILERQKYVALEQKLFAYKVATLPVDQERICLFEADLQGESPRYLMNLVLESGKELCAVFFRGCGGNNPQEGYRYFIGSRHIDVRPLEKELSGLFSGRGGGSEKMIQGFVKGNAASLKKWFAEREENVERRTGL
ncbi:MAG: alanyl-tRNA editing protein [Lachnospiraceae bacterium]|nr:alanyl-tRNA editing protein [Lachnospiraceae bacterium]